MKPQVNRFIFLTTASRSNTSGHQTTWAPGNVELRLHERAGILRATKRSNGLRTSNVETDANVATWIVAKQLVLTSSYGNRRLHQIRGRHGSRAGQPAPAQDRRRLRRRASLL